MRRLRYLATHSHLPRRTVRLRLTLVYGGLFLVSGAAMLAITYALVAHASGALPFKSGDLTGVIFKNSEASSSDSRPMQISGGSGDNLPGLSPEQAQELAQNQHAAELRQLLISSGVALAAMTILSIALGWLVAGRVLRPLRTMATAVHDISATNLHERLSLNGPNDELKELGSTFNDLLARLDASFQAQRQFVANASHELRTPLARQRTVAQVALADPDATSDSLRAAHERVLAAGAQQERLIDALLVLARGQSGVVRRERIDLARVAEQVVADRRAEAAARGLQVRTAFHPVAASGDSRLVERLVANLIDNAVRHNVEGGTVEITTGTRGEQSTVTVDNTGLVILESDVDRLFQPFQRLGPERTGDGIGLGLSIVAAIAEAHGATVRARARTDGGLQVAVGFPALSHNGSPGAADYRLEPARPGALDRTTKAAV